MKTVMIALGFLVGLLLFAVGLAPAATGAKPFGIVMGAGIGFFMMSYRSLKKVEEKTE